MLMLPSGSDVILPFHAILPLTTTHKASLDVIGKSSVSISRSASCSKMETAVLLMLRKLYLTWCIEMIYLNSGRWHLENPYVIPLTPWKPGQRYTEIVQPIVLPFKYMIYCALLKC